VLKISKNLKFKGVCVDRSSHAFWITYKTNPPIKYQKIKFRTKLQHVFNRIPKNRSIPYILDFEHILHLSDYSRDYVKMLDARDAIKSAIEDDNCAAIVGPSYGSLEITRRYYSDIEFLRKKFIRIAPAISVDSERKKLNSSQKSFKILNVGNKFWGKGTHIALKVFSLLKQKSNINVELIIVCNDVPVDIVLEEGVTLIKSSKLDISTKNHLFRTSQVFLFPCLHDSFGVYLECLSYGLPVITTNIYDKSEIVINNNTGYLLDTPIQLYDNGFAKQWHNWDEFQKTVRLAFIDGQFNDMIYEMVEKVEYLIENRRELNILSENSKDFCLDQLHFVKKNNLVREMYEEALKNR
jgi:glycosyltransferase involved in cell wall biosynthesis